MTTMFDKAVQAAIDTDQVDGRLSANAVVRAVLEAIREPDDAMKIAGLPFAEGWSALAAENAWQAVIDTILNGAK